MLERIEESWSHRKLKPARGMSKDRAKILMGYVISRLDCQVRKSKTNSCRSGDPDIMEREQHLEGLSFRFIEVARVFISVRSC